MRNAGAAQRLPPSIAILKRTGLTMLRLFDEQFNVATAGRGPSAEMRRFSAGIRVVTALLCTVMLLANEERVGPWPLSILMLYSAWSA